jgi:hypothetical protein
MEPNPTPRPQDSPRAESGTTLPTYTPPATHAACPACDAPVEGILDAYPPAIDTAAFMVLCPRCGASWSEFRTAQLGPRQTEPRWYNAAGNSLPPREEARRRRQAATLRREPPPDPSPAA